MKFGISSGLPDLPSGLKDPEYNLVAPIYRAVNAIAGNVATQVGAVQYSTSELSQLNPLGSVIRGGLTNRIPIKAGEDLAYGHLVYLQAVDSRLVAFKADNTVGTGKRALACVDTPGGIVTNSWGEAVFMTGVCAGISGTTLGNNYYLGPAGVTATSPALNKIVQPVGIGLGAAGLYLTITAEVVYVVAVVSLGSPGGGSGGHNLRVYYSDGTFINL